MTPQQFLQQKLQSRQYAGSYRKLQVQNNLIDFCSNDYLGFARSLELSEMINAELQNYPTILNGSTGSRLLAGNTIYAEDLEKLIAGFHDAQACLLFNSGYDANLGLLSSLPQRGDTVIHDELAHASIIDGIRLSHAKRHSFLHNNLHNLEQKLKAAHGNCYVVVESVYSMDGDFAPLTAIAQLVKQYNAVLIVDEAHALGVFNKGLVNQLQLQSAVFARIITFGKALGCHGAVVVGSNDLRQYLINFARSFIYTTAAPIHQLASIKMGYHLLAQSQLIIDELQIKIELYKSLMGDVPQSSKSSGAVQTLIIGGNQPTKHLASNLQQAGFDVRPILSPTVAEGTERLRICLHAHNSTEEITQLTNVIKINLHVK
ncbi:aminotransferase class I/II-fold pyridoxal phosphate-dependent enzyme [Mucilaginibacter terrae]|uniref:aminotransferase class I/II-fold pyridoxal phosphate-dependent enzyme n=1 Tax=Mucilaginibacter terrae TaxID=1955052 RepID=UPI00364432FE